MLSVISYLTVCHATELFADVNGDVNTTKDIINAYDIVVNGKFTSTSNTKGIHNLEALSIDANNIESHNIKAKNYVSCNSLKSHAVESPKIAVNKLNSHLITATDITATDDVKGHELRADTIHVTGQINVHDIKTKSITCGNVKGHDLRADTIHVTGKIIVHDITTKKLSANSVIARNLTVDDAIIANTLITNKLTINENLKIGKHKVVTNAKQFVKHLKDLTQTSAFNVSTIEFPKTKEKINLKQEASPGSVPIINKQKGGFLSQKVVFYHKKGWSNTDICNGKVLYANGKVTNEVVKSETGFVLPGQKKPIFEFTER